MTRRLSLSSAISVAAVFAAVACGDDPKGTEPTTKAPPAKTEQKTDPTGGEPPKQASTAIVERLQVRPAEAFAARYGDAKAIPLTPAENKLREGFAKAGLVYDPALSRFAREMARNFPREANVPEALTDALMSWAGVVGPPPRVQSTVGSGRYACGDPPGEDCGEAVDNLAKTVSPAQNKHAFGVGIAKLPDDSTRLVVATAPRLLEIEPFASNVAEGGSVQVSGRVVAGRKQPWIEVVDGQGKWSKIPAAQKGGTFAAEVRCASSGEHRVELMAQGPHGPEVVLNVPLYCGVEPPAEFTIEVESIDPSATADALSQQLLGHVNAARKTAGLPELSWDIDAAAVALGHSREMASAGYMGHRSPTTGDMSDRFKRAKIETLALRENVAMGGGPKGIHDALMRSPGHRVNILADNVVAVGIGIAFRPGQNGSRLLYVTQNFLKRS